MEEVNVGFEAVPLLKLVVGDHEYVLPETEGAPMEIVSPEQTFWLLPVLAAGSGFTVMVIAFEVAGLPVAQGVMLDVSTQVTASALTRELFAYVVLFVPTLLPFSFHWYDGELPPLVGVAVKVTLAPAQIVVAVAEMLTLTGSSELTVTEMELEVTLPQLLVTAQV